MLHALSLEIFLYFHHILFHTVYPFFGEGERDLFSANISLTSGKIMSVKKVANAEIRAAKKFLKSKKTSSDELSPKKFC